MLEQVSLPHRYPPGTTGASPSISDDEHRRRSELQTQGKCLMSLISAVCLSLNELPVAPISSLPSELLERIFDACVCWIYWSRKPEHCLAWTQVCTRWRDVALSSSRLWRYIDISHPHFASEFLLRSKTAPIYVVSQSPEKWFTDDFYPHTRRLQSIDVTLRFNDMEEFLSGIGLELPNLSTLSLALQSAQNIQCNIRFPSVRRLALDGVAVQWDLCSDLMHLTLRSLGEGFSPSTSQLCSILERSPQLECFQVENITAVVSEAVPNRIVTLPQLNELALFLQPPPFISCMLTALSIPSSAKLQLTCPSLGQLSTLISRSQRYIQNLDTGPDVTVLRLSRSSIQLLRSTSPPWSENPSLSIIFLVPLPRLLLHSLQHAFHLSRLTALELDARVLDEVPTVAMESLFITMPHITTLRVALSDGLGAILAPLGQLATTVTGQVLCPHLRLLSFCKPDSVWWNFAERWLQAVLMCVQDRAQFAPLQTLEFIRCRGITAKTIEPLQAFVQDVIILESHQ